MPSGAGTSGAVGGDGMFSWAPMSEGGAEGGNDGTISFGAISSVSLSTDLVKTKSLSAVRPPDTISSRWSAVRPAGSSSSSMLPSLRGAAPYFTTFICCRPCMRIPHKKLRNKPTGTRTPIRMSAAWFFSGGFELGGIIKDWTLRAHAREPCKRTPMPSRM